MSSSHDSHPDRSSDLPPTPSAPGAAHSNLDWSDSLYATVRDVAERLWRANGGHGTLQPTALANEAWLRIQNSPPTDALARRELVGIAVSALRRTLVDQARYRGAEKRSPVGGLVPFDETVVGVLDHDHVAIDDELERLRKLKPLAAQVFEARFYGALTVAEIRELHDLSEREVNNLWEFARMAITQTLREQ